MIAERGTPGSMGRKAGWWVMGVAAVVLAGAGVAFPGGVARGADPAPAPYALPWQLRPASVGNVLRLDSVRSTFDGAGGEEGSTYATLLLAAGRVATSTSLLARFGIVAHDPPVGESATVPTNLVLGAAHACRLPAPWRVTGYLMTALPTAGGGGNDPDPAEAAAIRAGVPARSAMDNAMFATNDVVVFPGVDVAWVRGGWTVQGEATLLQLWRVRGENVHRDARRTNLTAGLHAGWFAARTVSLGAELRHQRWLSTPAAVKGDDRQRDTTTLAAGLRYHWKLGARSWLRPGVSFTVPLDDPLSAADQQTIQLDIPYAF
jgi:hypothetical protein